MILTRLPAYLSCVIHRAHHFESWNKREEIDVPQPQFGILASYLGGPCRFGLGSTALQPTELSRCQTGKSMG